MPADHAFCESVVQIARWLVNPDGDRCSQPLLGPHLGMSASDGTDIASCRGRTACRVAARVAPGLTMGGYFQKSCTVARTIPCALMCFVGGIAIGGVGAGGFGVLYGGLWRLLHEQSDRTIAYELWFVIAGSITRAILGLCAMVDRIVNAEYWYERSGRFLRRPGHRGRFTIEEQSRVHGIEQHRIVLLADTPVARRVAHASGHSQTRNGVHQP